MIDQQRHDDLERLSINTLRFLAIDQIQKADGGHPGAALGCAPIMWLLYPQADEVQPEGSALVRSRSFRIVERACFGVAVWGAAPYRP